MFLKCNWNEDIEIWVIESGTISNFLKYFVLISLWRVNYYSLWNYLFLKDNLIKEKKDDFKLSLTKTLKECKNNVFRKKNVFTRVEIWVIELQFLIFYKNL